MPDLICAILQRFSGPITLRASRKKWGLVLFASILAVVVSVYALFFDQSERELSPFVTMALWVGLLFFGLGIPLSATLLLLPNVSTMVLDRNGFETTHLFRSRRTPWTDATGFQVVSVRNNKMVVYDDAKQKGGSLALLNTSLSGRNSGLPDTYGLSADDLARLMNEWRARALR